MRKPSVAIVVAARVAVLVHLALTLAVLAPLPSRASNDDSYFLDSDAAMCSGAVVASTSGPGSVWYNPAGLAFVQRSHISLSLSAGAFQLNRFARAVSLEQADGTIDHQAANGTRVAMVSPGVSYVFKLRRLTVGGGLFTTRDDAFKLAGASRYEDDAGHGSFLLTRIDSTRTRYHLGGALAIPLAPGLSLGFSLFGVYENIDDQASMVLTSRKQIEDTLYDTTATLLFRDEASRFGAQASAGITYRPVPDWSIGLHIRSPLLLLHESADAISLAQFTAIADPDQNGRGVGATATDYSAKDRKTADAGLLAPARITVGAAYRLQRVLLAAELDYLHPLRALDVRTSSDEEHEWLVNRKTVVNARLGALFAVNDKLELGLGAFTDRSPERALDGPPDTRLHFYGGTLGMRFFNTLDLAGRSEGLVFRTTMALRYAAGLGRAGSVDFSLREFIDADTSTARAQAQELHAYVGTSLSY